ncbi:MAG: nucleotidyl transferase AbiEii/AbiGii toxin family protein [Clostridiales Family XIII bacterium]|jgi:predicted nucleotidyltransferase component of viral defense system|nr:nucleotidyl transferase AbiEii/AbiGii toxin family protein [Clostridiales Family XIII bacterium]
MILHENKDFFTQVLTDTAAFLGLSDTGIVEKDYFVTFFLQKLAKRQPDVIFRGGTSLSKCHKLINRFSEDIDLNLDTEASKLTEGQRKRLKQDIISIIEDAGFVLENPEQIRSRRDFNRFLIGYPSASPVPFLKPHLIVETAVCIKSFPTKTMEAASLVYDFLAAQNATQEIEKCGLFPFSVKVQSIERTFIDKVFAIADYYLDGRVDMHSRHIYDLYKLYPHIAFDDTFKQLVAEVCEVRKSHITCLSAQDDIDLPRLLRKIVSEDYFKADYNQITGTLLFEDSPYENAITVIQRVLDDGCFA